MDWPAFVADAWVSMCAAIGSLIVLRHIDDLIPLAALAQRFRYCLWLIIFLMLIRIGHWGNGGYLFTALTYLSSALIPLAALTVAEGLMRLHAPLSLKYLCVGGTLVFGISAFFHFEATMFWQLTGLLCFQLVALLGIAIFVIKRDTTRLNREDNVAIDRIALSFAVILPFLASDFMRTSALDIPVRLGGIAVLALCWLALNLGRVSLRKRDISIGFIAIIVSSIALTFVVSELNPMETRTSFQIAIVLVAATMVLAIRQAALAFFIEDRNEIVLQALSAPRGSGPIDALSFLRSATHVGDVVLADTDLLSDFDIDHLTQHFQQRPVQAATANISEEQLKWLFARFDATHAMCLTTSPLRLALFKMPATSVLSIDALNALQRAASDIAHLPAQNSG